MTFTLSDINVITLWPVYYLINMLLHCDLYTIWQICYYILTFFAIWQKLYYIVIFLAIWQIFTCITLWPFLLFYIYLSTLWDIQRWTIWKTMLIIFKSIVTSYFPFIIAVSFLIASQKNTPSIICIHLLYWYMLYFFHV